jgi:DNA polymerase-3 subunit delta'
LEEPPERTIFILLSEKVEQLPATIRSRCQKLALAKPDRETHHAWLKQQHRLSENLDLLYSLSQGAPLVSLSYANENLLAQRQQCFKDWLALAKQQSHPAIIAENWQKVPEASLLFWLTTWLADLIKCGYRAPLEKLANPDFCSYLQELSQQLELNQIFSLYDALLNSRQKLNTTLNKLLMLEEILIQWRQLNQR